MPGREGGIPLSYNVGFTILSLVVSILSMLIAFSVIGLRLDKSKASSNDSNMEEIDLGTPAPLDKHNPLDHHSTDDKPQMQMQMQADDPDKQLDQPGSRFSWAGRKNTTPAMVSLPRSGRRGSLGKASRTSRGSEDDTGEFGMVPAKVSISGIAKIVGSGIICGGGIAAMRECISLEFAC